MPKHLLLGVALHHFTGSAKIVTMLHRYGHCSSYSQVLELENAMAIQTDSCDTLLPYNISIDGNEFSHYCFDNFDLREETLSGSGTTHSTHAIVIQETKPNFILTSNENTVSKSKSKWKFIPKPLPPFFCKKRVEPSLPAVLTRPTHLTTHGLEIRELAWTVCRAKLNHQFTVPEWSGWISLTTETSSTVQQSVVGYVAPILQPITEYSTVHHCMQLSMEASARHAQKYSFITMDLAAAKIAFDVKWQQPETFRNVIIHLGGFHTMCSYMGAIGKMMCGSGFEDVLMESGVCASGSIDKVMSGKHYNRAMRVHQLMLDATERLLLESFVQNNSLRIPVEAAEALAKEPSLDNLKLFLNTEGCPCFATEDNTFRDDVRKGQYGATAKFWFTYMESDWHLQRFHRAIKENDLDLYISAMGAMCSLLFSADHLNYARYLPLYLMQLKNLSVTHPGAKELLRNHGFLGVKVNCSCLSQRYRHDY